MAVHDFRAQRLYVSEPLSQGREFEVTRSQANYLTNVLRLGVGDSIFVFDGVNGEWRARLQQIARGACRLCVEDQVRSQCVGPDINYLFAPLKRARLDYMVQKATELGVRRLMPVFTRRTIVQRVNLERMRANVIEAAEQCGILHLPDVQAPVRLDRVLAAWPADRPLVFCDEAGTGEGTLADLKRLKRGPVGVLVGPEGGFEEAERDLLRAQAYTIPVSLGPRIMRADTAAVAALALVNAVVGDWRH